MATLSKLRLTPFAIVVGLKFNEGGSYAFDQAARLAAGIPTATIHLVHVFEEKTSREDAERLKEHLNLYVSEKTASLGNLDLRSVVVHLRRGTPSQGILQLATEVDAQLIVLGSSKHLARFSEPAAEQIIAKAACPVLVAGPKPEAVADAGIVIEPPCADCVARRQTTGGNEWWCARHAAHALAAHTFSYRRELPFSTHDSNLGPTGL